MLVVTTMPRQQEPKGGDRNADENSGTGKKKGFFDKETLKSQFQSLA